MTINQEYVKKLLLNGYEFNHGHVFICSLEGKHPTRCDWQVHSDDHRFLYSELYRPTELDAAIDKFVLIVNQIEERKNVKSRTTQKSVK